MAITHVNTQTAEQANATSVSVSKPSGQGDNDLIFAVFTSNSQNCTPPSGFIELSDETEDVFRQQIFYKIAGSGEPSSYTFSVPSAAPLLVTLSAFRGVDTANPIDIAIQTETSTTHSEPYTTPSLSGGTAGLLLYGRSARLSGTTPVTFTASGVTERIDAGVYSGGSVCYSSCLYTANSEYTSGGSKSGLAITSSGSESHNVVFTIALKSSGIPGTMTINMPSIPSVSMSGSNAVPGTMAINMPSLPSMSVNAFHGQYEGPLDVDVPISMSVNAVTAASGTLDVVVPINFNFPGETRIFSDNAIIWEREERWLVITQEGYYLGVRNIFQAPLHIDMPLPIVNFLGNASPLAGPADTYAEVFAPVIDADGVTAGGTAVVTATAYAATVTFGSAPPVGTVATTATVDQPVAKVSALAGLAICGCSIEQMNFDEMAEVTVYVPTISVNNDFTAANAGHVTVSCHN